VNAEVQLNNKCRISVQYEYLSDSLYEEDISEYFVSEIISLKQKKQGASEPTVVLGLGSRDLRVS